MKKFIQTLKCFFIKACVKCRFIKMPEPKSIYDFMAQNVRFKNAGYERHWHLLSEDGSVIGFVWFKHILGGWRLRLNTDKGDEWQKRGVIETISDLKAFL